MDNLNAFLKFTQLPKLLLFTEKKETPLMFKGMTSIFRDRIDVFCIISNNQFFSLGKLRRTTKKLSSNIILKSFQHY